MIIIKKSSLKKNNFLINMTYKKPYRLFRVNYKTKLIDIINQQII